MTAALFWTPSVKKWSLYVKCKNLWESSRKV